MNKLKQVAIKSAKEAGKVLLENYNKIKTIKEKTKDNFVTNVDIEAEQKIIEIINKNYPTHSILSEEEGLINKNSSYKWIIDPLDGTHNYMYSFPLFGVSIALEYKKEIILGVIYLPLFNQLFTSEKGKGSYLNNQKINVSPRKSLSKSLIMFDSSLHINKEKKLGTLSKIVELSFRIRITGVAVFALTAVAQGIADAHIIFKTNPWDVAAGFLLIKEAGGKITDFKGNNIDHYSKEFVASNGKMHDELLKLLN